MRRPSFSFSPHSDLTFWEIKNYLLPMAQLNIIIILGKKRTCMNWEAAQEEHCWIVLPMVAFIHLVGKNSFSENSYDFVLIVRS